MLRSILQCFKKIHCQRKNIRKVTLKKELKKPVTCRHCPVFAKQKYRKIPSTRLRQMGSGPSSLSTTARVV